MPWLELNGSTRELKDRETVVGSGAEAGWRVTNADLMPRHFIVCVEDGGATLRAGSSESVVAVNGRQVWTEPQPLGDRDVVHAGSADFVYSTGAPVPRPSRHEGPATRLAAPAVAAAHLVAVTEQTAFPLTSMSTGIGRDPSNAVPLRDATASRFHAEIRREAGGFALHSMGASGTRVNGKPVAAPLLLQDDDALEMAFETFRFTRGPLPPDVGIAPVTLVEPDEVRRPTPTVERAVTARPADLGDPTAAPSATPIAATDRARTLETSIPADIGRRSSRAWIVAVVVILLGAVLAALLRG